MGESRAAEGRSEAGGKRQAGGGMTAAGEKDMMWCVEELQRVSAAVTRSLIVCHEAQRLVKTGPGTHARHLAVPALEGGPREVSDVCELEMQAAKEVVSPSFPPRFCVSVPSPGGGVFCAVRNMPQQMTVGAMGHASSSLTLTHAHTNRQ